MKRMPVIVAGAVGAAVAVGAAAATVGMALAGGDAGSWTSIAHVVQPRTNAALVALPGGRAVLLGGTTMSGTSSGEVAPTIELWQDELDGLPIDERHDPTYPWSLIGFQPMGFSTSAVSIGPELILALDTSRFADRMDTWLVDAAGVRASTDRVTPIDGAALLPGREPQTEQHVPVLVATGDGQAVLVGTEHGVQRFDATSPTAGTWTPTAPMNHARDEMVVVALLDGRVLAAGGVVPTMDEKPHFIPTGDDATDTTATLRTAEMRDPATGAWTDLATLPFPLRRATAVTLTDGRVLVAGGLAERSTSSEIVSADPLLYDPTADTWTVLERPPVVALDPRLVALPDGSALAIGGNDENRHPVGVYRWDPETARWSAAGSLRVPRTDHGAVLLDDGRVLVAGGRDADRRETGVVELWTVPEDAGA